MHEELLQKLRLRGHEIESSGISHDGKLIIAVDGRMLTLPEIKKLLQPEDGPKQPELDINKLTGHPPR